MNKTININLGGFFFHIDETAYKKLKRYLEAISYSLSDDPQGKNEIIADIEARISELLSEKITDSRQVVNEGDIEEIIAIMGQPEDYADPNESYNDYDNSTPKRSKTSKKLFRDGSDKFLGGVCSGLGYYFNIDSIWVRAFFLILTLAGVGAGLIGYIILWVLLPEAKTTSEKLQMEGEAVNIDSIEKKIRSEIENISNKVKEGAHELSDKISNADYDALRHQTKSGLQDFIDTIGKIVLALFKVFGKFMGVLLIFISGITLIALLFSLFSIGSFEILNFDGPFIKYPPFFHNSILPKWLLTLFLFLLIGIPFIALFILGLRIISPNIKKLSTTTSLTLLGIWFVALFGFSFSGIEHATSNARVGTNISKSNIVFSREDPIKIRVQNDDNIHYYENLKRRDNTIEVSIDGEPFKYSNNLKIDIKKSETNNAYIQIKKRSKGRKQSSANESAEQIKYNFEVTNNTIVFDAFFLSDYKSIWKEEDVKATLYIPENMSVYFEESSKYFLNDIKNIQNVYDRDMTNHHFKMTPAGLNCLDCEDQNNTNQDTNYSNDDDNDDDVSFLFDSTINDSKAEFIIDKKTTKPQLERLVRWFKKRKNIDIDISNFKFNADNTIKTFALTVDCNDGFKGTSKSKNLFVEGDIHGFIRNYDDNSEIEFKIW